MIRFNEIQSMGPPLKELYFTFTLFSKNKIINLTWLSWRKKRILSKWSDMQVNLCQKPLFLQNMLCTKIVLNVRNNVCTHHAIPRLELGIFMYWTCNSMNNLSSYCGLVDAKIRADKDLPVFQATICYSWYYSSYSFCAIYDFLL